MIETELADHERRIDQLDTDLDEMCARADAIEGHVRNVAIAVLHLADLVGNIDDGDVLDALAALDFWVNGDDTTRGQPFALPA
jgi:hypothetical protein